MFHRVYQRAIMCNCLPPGERFIKTEISPDCWWKQRCPYIALVHLSGFSFKFFINIDHELFFVSIDSLRFQTIPVNSRENRGLLTPRSGSWSRGSIQPRDSLVEGNHHSVSQLHMQYRHMYMYIYNYIYMYIYIHIDL